VDLLAELFEAHGLPALIMAAQAGVIWYLYKQNQNRQEQLLILYQKRIDDITECKERYEELAHKLEGSIDLLIKVFKKNSG
jgi:hypothetical protein